MAGQSEHIWNPQGIQDPRQRLQLWRLWRFGPPPPPPLPAQPPPPPPLPDQPPPPPPLPDQPPPPPPPAQPPPPPPPAQPPPPPPPAQPPPPPPPPTGYQEYQAWRAMSLEAASARLPPRPPPFPVPLGEFEKEDYARVARERAQEMPWPFDDDLVNRTFMRQMIAAQRIHPEHIESESNIESTSDDCIYYCEKPLVEPRSVLGYLQAILYQNAPVFMYIPPDDNIPKVPYNIAQVEFEQEEEQDLPFEFPEFQQNPEFQQFQYTLFRGATEEELFSRVLDEFGKLIDPLRYYISGLNEDNAQNEHKLYHWIRLFNGYLTKELGNLNDLTSQQLLVGYFTFTKYAIEIADHMKSISGIRMGLYTFTLTVPKHWVYYNEMDQEPSGEEINWRQKLNSWLNELRNIELKLDALYMAICARRMVLRNLYRHRCKNGHSYMCNFVEIYGSYSLGDTHGSARGFDEAWDGWDGLTINDEPYEPIDLDELSGPGQGREPFNFDRDKDPPYWTTWMVAIYARPDEKPVTKNSETNMIMWPPEISRNEQIPTRAEPTAEMKANMAQAHAEFEANLAKEMGQGNDQAVPDEPPPPAAPPAPPALAPEDEAVYGDEIQLDDPY